MKERSPMAKRNKIPEDQEAALKAFAEKHGKDWKRKLLDAWYSGTDTAEPDGHLLRQIRNSYGPTWLQRY